MNEQHHSLFGLNALLGTLGLAPLSAAEEVQFNSYLDLLMKWNARMNLTAVRSRAEILRTHFVECIACARAVPQEVHSLLDLGSGAGFPGIPISICRPEIAVMLVESQTKKAAFLHEAVRSLGIGAKVLACRAETITAKFDCVTLRAVDRMSIAAATGARLLQNGGWLVALTTRTSMEEVQKAAGPVLKPEWIQIDLPGSEQRLLLMAQAAATTSAI
ncbi:16S rRNA (guanine(527)-N(7))-methyltransferase RsmG [Occallatibacter savannae]|uniref:16S rRNA (guanine(527)-N(7))-methyltransferase RsmG n=1 Tax=Occallatibacter savannae TaxID=1002691 RepID=UPI000D68D117|nr:16S rRNA (guanine(527)-N(7))-methyltransferase RsmG [Occallatibacter savannae]